MNSQNLLYDNPDINIQMKYPKKLINADAPLVEYALSALSELSTYALSFICFAVMHFFEKNTE